MEQNLAVMAKRFWSVTRVAMLILRKGVSKRKLMLDLNMMMKRGKIGCKALQNLVMFHHHNHNHNRQVSVCGDYEFSCSNTPANYYNKRKAVHSHNFFSCAHSPMTVDDDVFSNAVIKTLEMFNETASPALPGFGKSPMVRQLRISDSPFPLSNMEDDSRVDEAAEEFISRFYNQLRLQNKMSPQ